MQKTLANWLTHFETLHPVGIDMGLARVAQVWRNMCDIHNIKQLATKKVITVAGTNGKGSACKMLSLLLANQGYRVGTYTSPHIHHFCERVEINNSEVEDALLVRAFEAIESARGETSLSYFEATTLVGLLCFAWEKVDFAVLEVGLGGRLDAINIIDADAVLITSIGLDHEAFLGRDLSNIALEKAGVCRANAPCVYAETGVYDSVIQFTNDNNIPLVANNRDYFIDENHVNYQSRLLTIPKNIIELGEHQVANCAGVFVLLATLGLLPNNQPQLDDFSLMGRLQKVATFPDVILDVAHNEASARALANYLYAQSEKYNHIYAVIGMLKDKDHIATLSPFERLFTQVFCGRTEGERGFSDTELSKRVKSAIPCPVKACGSLDNALRDAQKVATSNDLIISFGSFIVVENLLKNNSTI